MYLRSALLGIACSSFAFISINQMTVSWAQTQTPQIVNPATPQLPPAPQTQTNPQQVNPNLVPTPALNQPQTQPTPQTPVNLRPQPQTSRVSAANNSFRSNSAYSPRLARSPFMLGDSFAPSLQIQDELGSGTRELPQGGGATRSKIAENSSSLPQDRWIFNYNHFQNAIEENLQNATDVDRFTLGFEKTFLDQTFSVEVRIPFIADNDFEAAGAFIRNGSEVGNLAVTLKGVLASDRDSLIAAGMTIDTPTGGGTLLTDLDDDFSLNIDNDAVHLAPFIGFLCAPANGNTHQGFIQVDVATNANGFQIQNTGGTPEAFASELLEQTLLYIDYSFSKQLYNSGRRRFSGGFDINRILGLFEMHYTTTLEDSDIVVNTNALSNSTGFELSSAGNRLDVVNLTLGTHTEFSNGTQLRLGTVAPITEDDDRFFDFEFQVQVNVLR